MLSCFESYKLDDQKALKQRDLTPVQAQQQTYFAKYLTSEKASTQSLCTLYTLLKDWFSKTCSWRTSSGQQYVRYGQLSAMEKMITLTLTNDAIVFQLHTLMFASWCHCNINAYGVLLLC